MTKMIASSVGLLHSIQGVTLTEHTKGRIEGQERIAGKEKEPETTKKSWEYWESLARRKDSGT